MTLCRELKGISGTATEYLKVNDRTFLRGWVEGVDLGERRSQGRVPGNAFFEELRETVEAIHKRGIAYNDLALSWVPGNGALSLENRL